MSKRGWPTGQVQIMKGRVGPASCDQGGEEGARAVDEDRVLLDDPGGTTQTRSACGILSAESVAPALFEVGRPTVEVSDHGAGRLQGEALPPRRGRRLTRKRSTKKMSIRTWCGNRTRRRHRQRRTRNVKTNRA